MRPDCNGTPVSDNDRGIALLVTLAFVTVAVAIGLQAHHMARVSVSMAALTRDRHALMQMSASGVHAAMAMLIDDRYANDTDGPTDNWASGDDVRGVMASLPFASGDVDVTVTDERGRIQVNALVAFPESRQFNESQRVIFTRFLGEWQSTHDMAAPIDIDTVINALKDWLDTGDDDATTGLSGAESAYYGDLDPPCTPANGPLRHIGEMALIRGVSQELFDGIGRHLTVFGVTAGDGSRFSFDGKINLNTAETAVIAGLLDEGLRDLAEAIVDYRRSLAAAGHKETLADPTWYKQAPGCGDLTIDPSLITLSSDLFRITATARDGAKSAAVTAVVERYTAEKTGQWTCRVLYWEAV